MKTRPGGVLNRVAAFATRMLVGTLVLSGPVPPHPASPSRPAALTFQERIDAEEAIERVYYAHQIGATAPFQEAVPREVLEAKVRDSLRLSAALEHFWDSGVTADSLRAELDRIARGTRFPARLHEIYDALGRDPETVQECFVRPVLVERLARGFFAFDRRIHAAARAEAVELRLRLLRGVLDPARVHPQRTEAELVRVAERDSAGPTPEPPSRSRMRIELGDDAYRRWRARAPVAVLQIGPLIEGPSEFTVSVVLDERPGEFRLATYTIPKVSWDEWWGRTAPTLDEGHVSSVADLAVPLPAAAGAASTEATWSDASGPTCAADDTWDNGSLYGVPETRTDHTAVWTGSLMIVWGGFGGAYLNTGARYDPLTDTWAPTTTTNAPDPRSLHTAVWTDSAMIVWGGSDDVGPLDTGKLYDPVADAWTDMATNKAPSPRSLHTAVWTGSLMVVWGGWSGTAPLSTGARYSPASNSWTTMTQTNAPVVRYNHTALWAGTQMVVWGGMGSTGPLNSGGRYNAGNDTWILPGTSTTNAPSARSLHTAIWTGTRMVVWGGLDGASAPLDSGGLYDPTLNTWAATRIEGAPAARSGHTAVWTGTRMLIWGGRSAGLEDSGQTYDPTVDLWSPLSAASPPSAREGHTVIWTGALMIVWGGSAGTSNGLNTGGRYDPAADSWTPTLTNDSPTPRFGHTMIWTGNFAVVWGGTSGAAVTNTGGRYDPLTDSWLPTPTMAAPAARAHHSAVWSGSQMLVWGGQSFSYLGTGGRYDPARNAWSAMAAGGAATPRAYHAAVWTGSVMVVWGGYDISFLNTGGRYDPVANSWSAQPIPTTGAPSGRYLHTAVWTGSRVLVWGGYSGAPLDSGGEFDPVGNSWSAIPTTGVPPQPRYNHAGVWTGSVMVIWGGLGATHLNDGGRYDPVQGIWSATSSIGAPAPRAEHTAVWTGARMLVWGGQDAASPLESGARYDPVQDHWESLSSSGAPSARSSHRAVWTGGSMIVWGGQDAVSAISTGGRYALGLQIDADQDGFMLCGDCDDANPQVWSPPGEATGLALSPQAGPTSPTTLSWVPPSSAGGSGALLYDLLRTMNPADFQGAATCLLSDGGPGTTSADPEIPPAGVSFYYLVRAQNACPFRAGPLGIDSKGTPRVGRVCP